jgi:lipid II:glycine glycyltransferase (peptidoglycan interpeptide bridge formation enzyme)
VTTVNADWDAFVAESATPTHLQTTAWAAIKRANGWAAFRVMASDVGAQVLVRRPRGMPWGLGYVPRGPVGTLSPEAIEQLTARLRDAARRRRLGYVRIEPEAAAGGDVEDALRRSGWRTAPHVQPESTRIIDLTRDEALIWGDLHRKCRQSVTKSERLGVRVSEADGTRLGEFYEIHADATRRAGIVPRAERTYQEMWRELEPRGMARLLFAELVESGESVATLFLVSCGRRVVDLYGGTTSEGGRTRANYLLKWEAIRRCREAGFAEYDLWGLPREGIAQFKSGFGGREVHYTGAWDLVTDRVGRGVLMAGQEARRRYVAWRYPRKGRAAMAEEPSA